MPTVLLINGFRFFFFSGDGGEPIHVHVKKGDGDGKIWLEPDIKIAYLVEFNRQEEKQIIEIAEQHQRMIKDKWNEFFGK